MSLKRKFEEYHDPDYPQQSIPVAKQSRPNNIPAEERCDKIRTIVRREFELEHQRKEDELQQIEQKLQQSKRLLQRVRYAIVANFYRRPNLEYTEQELQQMHAVVAAESPSATVTVETKSVQAPIHPSLKKLLGKRPIDYDEILKIRPARQAAKTAKCSLSQKLRTKKEKRRHKQQEAITIREDVEPKVPRYVSPIKQEPQFEKLTSARGRNDFRHLLAVGNTSKFIGEEKSLDGVTHKWLVYVKTKSSDSDVADIVSKVRFFLHPSYKPNDVVIVDFPPFHISRRGWGEFPIRVQLFFHPHIQQKPVQIIHNLVLDKRMTGLQTMGAETIVELHLNVPNTKQQETTDELVKSQTQIDQPNEVHEMIQRIFKEEPPIDLPATVLDESDDNSMVGNSFGVTDDSTTTDGTHDPPTIAPMCIKVEKNDHDYSECMPPTSPEPIGLQINTVDEPAAHQTNVAVVTVPVAVQQQQPHEIKKQNLVKCLDSNGKVIVVELVVDPNNPKQIKIVRNPKINSTHVIASSSTQSTIGSSQAKTAATLPAVSRAIVPNTAMVSIPHLKLANYNGLPNNTLTANQQPLNMANFVVSKAAGTSPKLIKIARVIQSSASAKQQPILIASNEKPAPAMQPAQHIPNAATPFGSQIYIVRPTATTTKPKPKQESLLKPQISLLKTNLNKSRFMAATLAAPSPPSQLQNAMRPQHLQPSILGIKFRNAYGLVNTNPLNYLKRLETLFLDQYTFHDIHAAIKVLLRHVPLFNRSAANDRHYEAAFPFVCASEEAFNELPPMHKRCNEWYRAKFIQRLCRKHPDLKCMSDKWWTTKEIMLYGRRLGYTPCMEVRDSSACEMNELEIRSVVQSEVKREQLKNSETLTRRTIVNDWISECEQSVSAFSMRFEEDAMINVDDDDKDDTNSTRRQSVCDDKQTSSGKAVKLLQIDKNIAKEYAWVTDACRDIQIQLPSEEMCEGVMHFSAHRVLVTALQSFLEDLVRQALFKKSETNDNDNTIRTEDIRKTISEVDRFDFCTNRHLGVTPINVPPCKP